DQCAHAGVSSRGQRARVAGKEYVENQRRPCPYRVDREEEGDLSVDRRAEDAAGVGLEDETADARNQPATEEDGVLPDQAALAELDQTLPKARRGAGLHSPGDST